MITQLFPKHPEIQKQVNKPSCFMRSRDLETKLVLHCELSQNRAPKLASIIRRYDRDVDSSAIFPALRYPEIYILQGGFNEFFKNNLAHMKNLIVPPGNAEYWVFGWWWKLK